MQSPLAKIPFCTIHVPYVFQGVREPISMGRTFSIFDVKGADGWTLPIVVFDGENGSAISHDVLRFTKMLRNRGDSFAKIRAACNSLGLLHDYYVCAYGGSIIHSESIPSLVARFLWARRTGTIDTAANTDVTELRWRPVDRLAVARDRFHLAEYSDFCVRDGGWLPLGPTTYPEEARHSVLSRIAKRSPGPRPGDLLHHLASRRKGQPVFGIDLPERHFSRPARRLAKQFPSSDAVRAMIDSTESIVQRMMLIEGFYGGPRLSEELHKWRCDVLPGRLRKSIFQSDEPSFVPLVIHAHPSQSTYVGDDGRHGADRGQVLRNKYGLVSRHLIDPDPMWAGWKGMAFDESTRCISQVYWSDLERAAEYEALFRRLRSEIWPMVPDDILNSHPYLYINDCPHQPEFGLPMKLSNGRKVFERAAARVGLDPQRFRDGSHASRHFYKATLATSLKLTPEQIQLCMHHIWRFSQEAYGISIAEMHKALNDALKPAAIGVRS
jgi:hypothetical protein